MKVVSINNNYNYSKYNNLSNIKNTYPQNNASLQTQPLQKQVSFSGNIFTDAINYARARRMVDVLYEHVTTHEGLNKFVLKNYGLEQFEGIQFGIKVFKGMTLKEIQYLCDDLHVIAVKRGCNNMCGYCYADAKPSNREMSYEDFHSIMEGFKTLRKRMHNLDIFGEHQPRPNDEPIYKTTELFYDADCMNLSVKDKKGKVYDFIDLSTELHEALGRTTVFDTSGWHINNKKAQALAEKYVEHFSDPKNMEKLEAFNVSFNVFNASYVASRKALKNGDKVKATRLRERFTTNMANMLFTFTPLLDSPKYIIMMRSFNSSLSKNTRGYDERDMSKLMGEVMAKLTVMYERDLEGAQKYVKSRADIEKFRRQYSRKMDGIHTALNSAGRMKKFVEENGIKASNLQNHDKTTPVVQAMIDDSPRLAEINSIMHRLIDADGRIYHMDYARFFPTELQLNIKGKDIPTPKLANLVEDYVVTREKINK